jgi:Uma2 family endonuclease
MRQPLPEHISLADFTAWERLQTERFEWIDGVVVRCEGGSDEHACIITNLISALHIAVAYGPCFVRGSDRKLIPRDAEGNDLGSFYADLFVSCSPQDRRSNAAHFPRLVVEVVSPHVGAEFTSKKEAYLRSAKLVDYLVVDSTRRYVVRYSWPESGDDRTRLVTAEYRRGPVHLPSLGLEISFDAIYADTNVPAILHPIRIDDAIEDEIALDS